MTESQKSFIQVYQKQQEESFSKGKQIAEFLNLKEESGRYNTIWGNKTPEGLYLNILRIVESKERVI